MHARKAHDELVKLVDSAPGDLNTLVRSAVLLDGLDRNNTPRHLEEFSNATARERILSTRCWFEVLCGVGEDGSWPEETVRQFTRDELSNVEAEISSDGMHFKCWPE